MEMDYIPLPKKIPQVDWFFWFGLALAAAVVCGTVLGAIVFFI